MDKYLIEKKIGDGTFGSVYKALNSSSDRHKYVAIKKLKSRIDCWVKCLSLNEIRALSKLYHPNVVKLLEVIKANGEVYLVFEYMERNLYQLIKERRLDMVEVRNIMFQVLQGLYYIHAQNIFHRDIKPENILEYNGRVKIADFGLARCFNSSPPFTDYVSTRWYRAPEILLGSNAYDKSIDIFAVGCIFAELITGSPLFPGKNQLDQLHKILSMSGASAFTSSPQLVHLTKKVDIFFKKLDRQSLSSVLKGYDRKAIDLIEKMIQVDPTKRITAEDSLRHELFHVGLSKLPAQHSKNEEPLQSQREKKNKKAQYLLREQGSFDGFQDQASDRSHNITANTRTKKNTMINFDMITPCQPGANLYELFQKEQEASNG